VEAIGDDLWVQQSERIDGVVWLLHTSHEDDRGSFTEWYRASTFSRIAGRTPQQINVSRSVPGVLRGIHWHQHQHDYWHVVKGIAQVVVHNRNDNTHESRKLMAGHGVVIPPGIGHGFLAIDDFILLYGVTQEYDREYPDEHEYDALEGHHNIEWDLPQENLIRSVRDTNAAAWYA
jgi:dTDP-4-dehydrorhamnose 3,5-epimerase